MIILMGQSQKYHSDARFQISSRSDIKNPVKNPSSTILELDLWWLWMKTEGWVVVRILLKTVGDEFSNDCDHIQSCHIWTQLNLDIDTLFATVLFVSVNNI